jgi:putative transposase
MTKPSPFKYFKTSPEIIRLAVILCVRFPLSLRNVEDLLHERGVEISHETVQFWWHRFGPMFAAQMVCVRFPLSLRNTEDLLHERGVEINHETVRFWWHRFGPLGARFGPSPVHVSPPRRHLYYRGSGMAPTVLSPAVQ